MSKKAYNTRDLLPTLKRLDDLLLRAQRAAIETPPDRDRSHPAWDVAELLGQAREKVLMAQEVASNSKRASDLSSLIRLASTMEKGSEERRAILAGLKKAFTSRDDEKAPYEKGGFVYLDSTHTYTDEADAKKHADAMKSAEVKGVDGITVKRDGKKVTQSLKIKGDLASAKKQHAAIRERASDVAFEAMAKKGKKTSAYFGDRQGFDPEDLNTLAGEIVAYAYEGDGPEPGPSGLRYLAQDNGAIWRAAEEAGFESDDPALEYFMELSDNDRFRLLARRR
jgi:hypothetical protein